MRPRWLFPLKCPRVKLDEAIAMSETVIERISVIDDIEHRVPSSELSGMSAVQAASSMSLYLVLREDRVLQF